MKNAGDFILIFVICLILFKEKHFLFHCMHCFVSMYLSGRKSLFNVFPQSMVYLLFLALFRALSQCPFTAKIPICIANT